MLFRSATKPRSEVEKSFKRLRGRLGRIGFFIAVVLSALAQPLLAFSFGSNFLDAQPALIILSWSLVPGFVNGLTVVYLYALGKEADANRMLAWALAIQILIAIPLIYSFAATGAAVSAIIGDLVLWVLLQRILS